MAESLREEAARRGVTVYRVRVERGAQRGLPASVAVGKPRRGQLTIREAAAGYVPARGLQPNRYRIWWTRVADGTIAGVEDTDAFPGRILGRVALDPFDADYDDPLDAIMVSAVTVRR